MPFDPKINLPEHIMNPSWCQRIKRKFMTIKPIFGLGSVFPQFFCHEPKIKKVDLSNLPFALDAARVRVRFIETSNVGTRLPTAANYVVELYVDNEWKIWPYVQSFSFKVDVETMFPKIELVWVDNLREK